MATNELRPVSFSIAAFASSRVYQVVGFDCLGLSISRTPRQGLRSTIPLLTAIEKMELASPRTWLREFRESLGASDVRNSNPWWVL
jgi:hypothetical protein